MLTYNTIPSLPTQPTPISLKAQVKVSDMVDGSSLKVHFVHLNTLELGEPNLR
jgi:hypothetical protein